MKVARERRQSSAGGSDTRRQPTPYFDSSSPSLLSHTIPLPPTFGTRCRMSAAVRLAFLMAARIEKDEAVRRLLDGVVKDSRLALGAMLVSFSEPKHNNILRDFTHVSQDRLRETLRARFKAEYVNSGRSIFDDDPTPILGFRVMYQLGDREMVTGVHDGSFKARPRRH